MTGRKHRIDGAPDREPIRGRFRARVLSRFIGDRRGASAIEFGFVVFPFMMLLGGILEDGIAYFRLLQLQNAAQNAARLLRVNSLSNGFTPKQFQDNYVCPIYQTRPGALGAMFDCNRVIVAIVSTKTWTATTIPFKTDASTIINSYALYGTSTSSATAPAANEVGLVLVIYKATSFFPGFRNIVLGKIPRDSNYYYPYGKAMFRVEPKV